MRFVNRSIVEGQRSFARSRGRMPFCMFSTSCWYSIFFLSLLASFDLWCRSLPLELVFPVYVFIIVVHGTCALVVEGETSGSRVLCTSTVGSVECFCECLLWFRFTSFIPSSLRCCSVFTRVQSPSFALFLCRIRLLPHFFVSSPLPQCPIPPPPLCPLGLFCCLLTCCISSVPSTRAVTL